MTRDEALQRAGQQIDAIIETHLVTLEARIRADLVATGEEDQDALDVPPDPDAAWSRITVEEILVRERAWWDGWRASSLVLIRDLLERVDTPRRPRGAAVTAVGG